MAIRTGDRVTEDGKTLAVWLKGRWYRMIAGDMTALEPADPFDAGLIAICNAAQPPPPEARPLPNWIEAKIRMIDVLLGDRAMKWDRTR